jgi:hypothetical protein
VTGIRSSEPDPASLPSSSDGSALNGRVIVIAATLGLLIATYLLTTQGWRHSMLFVVGFCAGGVLYHAAFGFTGAWRDMIR